MRHLDSFVELPLKVHTLHSQVSDGFRGTAKAIKQSTLSFSDIPAMAVAGGGRLSDRPADIELM